MASLKMLKIWRLLVFVFLHIHILGFTKSYGQGLSRNRDAFFSKPVYITIDMENESQIDTLRLEIYDHAPISSLSDRCVTNLKRNKNGLYGLKIDKKASPFYISLFREVSETNSPKRLFHLYLIEPGDSIRIKIISDTTYKLARISNWSQVSTYSKQYKFFFSGNGAAKLQCRYEIDRAISAESSKNTFFDHFGELKSDNHFEESHRLSRSFLLRYKDKMSKIGYFTTAVDVFSAIELDRLENISNEVYLLSDSSLTRRLLDKYVYITDSQFAQIPYSAKALSAKYFKFLADRMIILKRLGSKKIFSENDIKEGYYGLKKYYIGELRDKVVTYFILKLANSAIPPYLINDALLTARTRYCLSEIKLFAGSNLQGKPAYIFSLPDRNDKLVKLSDFIGKVVFIDFWFTGCFACADYFKTHVSKVKEKFKLNPNVVFISISIDASKSKWIEGVSMGIYTTIDNINLYTEGKGADHLVVKRYNISSYPSPILIDKEGKIISNDKVTLMSNSIDNLVKLINIALINK